MKSLDAKWGKALVYLGATLAACIGLLLAGLTASAKTVPALSSSLAVERSVIVKGGTKPLYIKVQFTAPELDIAPSRRPPLNLSLVLDRSGSMQDKGKIEYLREAAKMAVSRLSERDIVSVVEFDDRITLMWPASRAGNSEQLLARIDDLTPRGSTNIADGLKRGVQEAQSAMERLRLSPDTLNRVILLSDGLANVGERDPVAISRIAGSARRDGVRVSALGLGLDYDEDMMQAIAESGGGKYYYAEHPAQLARIFEQELKTAFATRARDVHLEFHGTGAVKRAEIIGFDNASGRNAQADWPDFYAGETRTALIRLEVNAGSEGDTDLGSFNVTWRDAQSGAAGTMSQRIRVKISQDKIAAEKSLNKDVAVEASLAESERVLAANVKLAQAGKTNEAQAANARVITELKEKNSMLKDARLSRKIEAMSVEQSQMTAAAAAPAPEAMQNYLKSSKQRLYQAKSGNRAGYVLQPGDKGVEVERLQTALAKAGVYRDKVNGIYDAATAAAVKAYQIKSGAPDADGIAGASTQAALGLY